MAQTVTGVQLPSHADVATLASAKAPIETLWRRDEGSSPVHIAAGAGDASVFAAEKAAVAQLIRGGEDVPAEASAEDEES